MWTHQGGWKSKPLPFFCLKQWNLPIHGISHRGLPPACFVHCCPMKSSAFLFEVDQRVKVLDGGQSQSRPRAVQIKVLLSESMSLNCNWSQTYKKCSVNLKQQQKLTFYHLWALDSLKRRTVSQAWLRQFNQFTLFGPSAIKPQRQSQILLLNVTF